MSVKINSVSNISFLNPSDTEIGKNSTPANNTATDYENSSANSFQTLEGQMRKLQLLS